MSSKLANELVEARSVGAFLRARGGTLRPHLFAALKREVDNLVHTDLNAARRLVGRIEQLATLTDDPRNKAFAQASRARMLHLLGRHDEANHLYAGAAKTLRASGLAKDAAIIQKQQVDALTHISRYSDALATARSARRVLVATDPVQLAQLEMNVGNVYYMMDRYHKALEHYNRARQILDKRGSARMRALVDISRANIFTELDQPDEALRLFASAARTSERAKQHVLAALVRYYSAYIHFLRGHYNAALQSYYDARDRLAALGSIHYAAWCDLEIAEVLLALNAFDDAAENARHAREQFTELSMPYESAKAQMIAGLAMAGLKQFDAAVKELTEAREAFARNKNSTFAALADSYMAELALKRGNADEALSRAGLALRTFARQKLLIKAARAQLLVARAAHSTGDSVRAKRLARAALRRVEGRFAPSLVYKCHHLIGKIEREHGRTQKSLESFRRAVDVVEKMRGGIASDELRATFLSDKIEVYEDAINACLDEGGASAIAEAFSLAESSKSRALSDLLARYLRDGWATAGREGADTAQRARLLRLIEDLNWYSSQANLEDERGNQRRASVSDRYAREVVRRERHIAELFRRVEAEGFSFGEMQRMQAISADDFLKTLEPDETAIEYFSVGDEVSAFVASRGEIKAVRGVAHRRDIEQALTALRFQLEKFNYGGRYADQHFDQLNGAANYYLAMLYRMAFAALEPYLKSERIIIIPHGTLHYVPFHALLNRRGYLVDQYEISYAPSATVLKLCRERGKQFETSNGASGHTTQAPRRIHKSAGGRRGLVALGVAQRDTPSIKAEIRALVGLFPDAITLTGAQATRENLKKFAPAARYLHLASHAHFRRDNPMFSFLKLVDSPLNFYSLLDLKLNAEMVTLSACHTGVNMIFPGDELHGLMRGFLYAGAPSLVASLWAANDVSTAEFMKEMYSQVRGGASKRAALRSAQLAVKDAYGHPYYWAPFILMGNPN